MRKPIGLPSHLIERLLRTDRKEEIDAMAHTEKQDLNGIFLRRWSESEHNSILESIVFRFLLLFSLAALWILALLVYWQWIKP